MGASPWHSLANGRPLYIHIRSTFSCHTSSALRGLDTADKVPATPRFRHLWVSGERNELLFNVKIYTMISSALKMCKHCSIGHVVSFDRFIHVGGVHHGLPIFVWILCGKFLMNDYLRCDYWMANAGVTFFTCMHIDCNIDDVLTA